MTSQSTSNLPLSKALLWILLSTTFVIVFTVLGYLYYQHVRVLELRDGRYYVTVVSQKTPHEHLLDTNYLAELMGLSYDHPVNLHAFSERNAEKRLLMQPLIKSAKVKKVFPHTVTVTYSVRTPIARVRDLSNTGVDAKGVLLPLDPFFSDEMIRSLPEVYLGLTEVPNPPWGSTLASQEMKLALEIFHFLELHGDSVHCLDTSKAYAQSYGQRQIIFTSPEGNLLRLSPKHYQEDWANYLVIRDHLQATGETAAILDMRIPKLAFIKKEGHDIPSSS